MSLSTWVYNTVPGPLRDALVSLRGLRLKSLRYTDFTWEKFGEYQKTQWWSPEQIRDMQLEKLRRMLNDAAAHCPYYENIFNNTGLRPNDIRSLDDLCKMPILPKKVLRNNAKSLQDRRFLKKSFWVANTSGTSGMPLSVRYLHEDMQERFALFERLFDWYTPGKWRERASFTGKLVLPTSKPAKRVYVRNQPLRQNLYSLHHLEEGYFEKYFKALENQSPHQVDGILSPIYILSRIFINRGWRFTNPPNVVITTSETLWDHMRASISEGFGATVANQYSSQEGAPIIYECPLGGFHLCAESGIVEIIDNEGNPSKPGEIGRLVVTSFLTKATPLIRYDIGDMAVSSDKKCPCGRGLPLIEAIYGRVDDMFFTEERGLVARVDSAFKGIPTCIINSQVAQVGVNSFELRIVTDNDQYKGEYGETIAQNLRLYLGESVEISIKMVDCLPFGPGGKIKAMVNEAGIYGKYDNIGKSWMHIS